jgi:hypothetical protein
VQPVICRFDFYKKKITKPNFIFFKNQNQFKLTGFGLVQFGFLGQKPVWLGFFRFGFGSVFSVSDL